MITLTESEELYFYISFAAFLCFIDHCLSDNFKEEKPFTLGTTGENQ